jgi:hypothetical protein
VLPMKMRRALILMLLMLGVFSTPVPAWEAEPRKAGAYFASFEAKPYKMVDDFGIPPLYDCGLQYYYYIPCPTGSWFWAYSGWGPGDILATVFTMGEQGTGAFVPCDPYVCAHIEAVRVLELSGYGDAYPGVYGVELDIYCCDAESYPCVHLWNSGPLDLGFGWNNIEIRPIIEISRCAAECGDWDPASPRFALTITMVGTGSGYPAVGFDNIGSSLGAGCIMHDIGCLPVVYPRSWMGGSGERVHSGYVGRYAFEYWPPLPLPDGSVYGGETGLRCGFVEAAWRMYFHCTHVPTPPCATIHSTSWGGIKSLYR